VLLSLPEIRIERPFLALPSVDADANDATQSALPLGISKLPFMKACTELSLSS